jgi:hypothetical protein
MLAFKIGESKIQIFQNRGIKTILKPKLKEGREEVAERVNDRREKSRDVVLKVNIFCPTYIVDHFCTFFCFTNVLVLC